MSYTQRGPRCWSEDALLGGGGSGVSQQLQPGDRGEAEGGPGEGAQHPCPRDTLLPVWALPCPLGAPSLAQPWGPVALAGRAAPGLGQGSIAPPPATATGSEMGPGTGWRPLGRGRATHWISRNARFSTSFTLYLRLNLEEGGDSSQPIPHRKVPEARPHRGAGPYLARSRGSIMFLLWKLLNRSRRMLPSGCGTRRGLSGRLAETLGP